MRDLLDKEGKALKGGKALVDVRSPGEYSGELLHMAELPARRARCAAATSPARATSPGRRPCARTAPSSPSKNCANSTSGKGITNDKDVVAYCRIGERSSHTWFVLTYLLGYDHVRNYDG